MAGVRGILFKKLFRGFKSQWKQFLSLFFIGTMAMSLYIGLYANALCLESRVESVYTDGNLADVNIAVSSYDEDDLSHVVSLAEPYGLNGSESRYVLGASISANSCNLIVAPSLSSISINKPINIVDRSSTDTEFFLTSSLYRTTGNYAREVVVSASEITNLLYYSAQDNGYVGSRSELLTELDSLCTSTENPLRENQISLSYHYTGYTDSPEGIVNDTFSIRMLYVGKKTFQNGVASFISSNFSDATRLNALFGLTTNDISSPTSFPRDNQYLLDMDSHDGLEGLEEEILAYFQNGSAGNVSSITDRSTYTFVIATSTEIGQAYSLCYVFPPFFYLVGFLVCVTTNNQLLTRERKNIGIMKSLSVPRKWIYLHYGLYTGLPIFFPAWPRWALGPGYSQSPSTSNTGRFMTSPRSFIHSPSSRPFWGRPSSFSPPCWSPRFCFGSR